GLEVRHGHRGESQEHFIRSRYRKRELVDDWRDQRPPPGQWLKGTRFRQKIHSAPACNTNSTAPIRSISPSPSMTKLGRAVCNSNPAAALSATGSVRRQRDVKRGPSAAQVKAVSLLDTSLPPPRAAKYCSASVAQGAIWSRLCPSQRHASRRATQRPISTATSGTSADSSSRSKP